MGQKRDNFRNPMEKTDACPVSFPAPSLKFVLIFAALFAAEARLYAQEYLWGILMGLSLNLEYTEITTGSVLHSYTKYDYNYGTYKREMADWILDLPLIIDFRFLEAGIGLWASQSSQQTVWNETSYDNRDGRIDGEVSGKYARHADTSGGFCFFALKPPVYRMYNVAFFPLFSVEYRWKTGISNAEKDFIDTGREWANLWYKLGFGFDIKYSNGKFGRLEFLYGFRGENEYEKNLRQRDETAAFGTPFTVTIKISGALWLFHKKQKPAQENRQEAAP